MLGPSVGPLALIMLARDPEYRDKPKNYDLEELSRPDEVWMLTRAGEAAREVLDSMRHAHCLDLCCGTGLSMERFVSHPNVVEVVGVDSSAPYLKYAAKKRHLATNRVPPQFICHDAVTVSLPLRHWDLIMLSSAYHHIEDARKLKFLKRVRNLLAPRGRAIIAENVLPPYKDSSRDNADYCRAVRAFYRAVLDTALRFNPKLSPRVRKLIQRPGQHGIEGKYEYKVHWSILKGHLEQARLRLVGPPQCVWPSNKGVLPENSGNYVMVLAPTSYR